MHSAGAVRVTRLIRVDGRDDVRFLGLLLLVFFGGMLFGDAVVC